MLESRRGGDDCGYAEIDPTGRYGRFEEILGRGAMKTVYRAFDEHHGIEVAWNQAKISDVLRSPEAMEHLYSEVHLLSTLSHDSIIQFHASWVDSRKRTFNFITEMFTSGSLREYRQRHKRVSIRAVKGWARQILHGLVYLHSHDPPVIHRDLKCDNIFVNGNHGQVKIGDLGLAAVLRNSQSAHSVIGTPEFMAPELYDEEYNELVDIYSFGMCVLEMLTGEYPYSECSNPAQIYKKVISGKLPGAFYKVQDPEARRFIGKCLENASTRSSAKELLLDPFLQLEGTDPSPTLRGEFYKTDLESQSPRPEVAYNPETRKNVDMKITGKINPDDDTIFLKVQFADKEGHARNVYFPFDVISDTGIDVANEMVKELNITDRHPTQIAEVIELEISALLPNWKERKLADEHRHVHRYSDEDDEMHHSLFYVSSSTSSRGSFLSEGPSNATLVNNHINAHRSHSCHQGSNMFTSDVYDTSSLSSMHSEIYSYKSCNFGSEREPEQTSRRREHQPLPQNQKASRFCLQEKTRANSNVTEKFPPQQSCGRGSSCGSPRGNRELATNRSFVDMQSQLLHKTLVEEVNKRVSNSVGAVEDVGYQDPCGSSFKAKKSSGGIAKKLGFAWSS